MAQTNIKQDITSLCDDFVEFWKQLKEEIEQIPDDNKAEVIHKWENFFVEHKDVVRKLDIVKVRAELLAEELLKNL